MKFSRNSKKPYLDKSQKPWPKIKLSSFQAVHLRHFSEQQKFGCHKSLSLVIAKCYCCLGSPPGVSTFLAGGSEELKKKRSQIWKKKKKKKTSRTTLFRVQQQYRLERDALLRLTASFMSEASRALTTACGGAWFLAVVGRVAVFVGALFSIIHH